MFAEHRSPTSTRSLLDSPDSLLSKSSSELLRAPPNCIEISLLYLHGILFFLGYTERAQKAIRLSRWLIRRPVRLVRQKCLFVKICITFLGTVLALIALSRTLVRWINTHRTPNPRPVDSSEQLTISSSAIWSAGQRQKAIASSPGLLVGCFSRVNSISTAKSHEATGLYECCGVFTVMLRWSTWPLSMKRTATPIESLCDVCDQKCLKLSFQVHVLQTFRLITGKDMLFICSRFVVIRRGRQFQMSKHVTRLSCDELWPSSVTAKSWEFFQQLRKQFALHLEILRSNIFWIQIFKSKFDVHSMSAAWSPGTLQAPFEWLTRRLAILLVILV